MRQRRSSALVASLLLSPAVQWQASAPGDVFAPEADTVPLSRFVDGQSLAYSAPGVLAEVDVPVHPDILAWLDSATIKATVNKTVSGGSENVTWDPVLIGADFVRVQPESEDDFVITSSQLENDFPIVTHWCSSDNGGRGGFHLNAADGITALNFDPSTGTISEDLTGTEDPETCDLSPDGPKFNPNLALFSDGTAGSLSVFEPADERYIGETWETSAVSEEVVIWVSDEIRAEYGWPVMHRNTVEAFVAGPWMGGPCEPDHELDVIDGAPLFQTVHGIVVDFDDPGIEGNEGSLGSFVLPPGWSGSGSRYPLLFSGYYDVHGLSFGDAKNAVYTGIGGLARDFGRGAVGVLWNGGGSGVSQTKQRSTFDNADMLIDMAEEHCRGHGLKIVTTGGSRGGTTSLSIASNPYDYPYRVVYALADNPQTRIGRLAVDFNNPTYQLVQATVSDLTGYCRGWEPGWTHPVSGKTNAELSNLALFGTADQTEIDGELDNASGDFVDAIVGDGPHAGVDGLVLRFSTHDFSKPFAHLAEYYDKVNGRVPVHCEISYRFGHTFVTGTRPNEADLLNQIWVQDPGFLTGTDDDDFNPGLFHFKRKGEEHPEVQQGEEIWPAYQPLVLEAPTQAIVGQAASWTLVGKPGATYSLWLAEVDFIDWAFGNPPFASPVYVGSPIVLDRTLTDPGGGAHFGFDSLLLGWPFDPADWQAVVHAVTYEPDASTSITAVYDANAVIAAPPDPAGLWGKYSYTILRPALGCSPDPCPPIQGSTDTFSRTSGLSTEECEGSGCPEPAPR